MSVSIFLFIFVLIHLSIHLSIYLSFIYLAIYLYLFSYLSSYLALYLSIYIILCELTISSLLLVIWLAAHRAILETFHHNKYFFIHIIFALFHLTSNRFNNLIIIINNNVCAPITFNNPVKVCFSNKKYLITIHKLPTQIVKVYF